MATLPIVYGHKESGHSYKVRFALDLLGIEYEYRAVEVFRPRAERRADWQAESRFGEVPVFVDGAQTIVQSNAILLYLARKNSALGWDSDPDLLQQWLFWEANRIAMSLPHIRFHAHFEVPIAAEVLSWMHDRMKADLDTLDSNLSRTSFLMGSSVSAADIACSAYMFFADQIPLDLGHWKNVLRWLDDIRSLPVWLHPYDLRD